MAWLIHKTRWNALARAHARDAVYVPAVSREISRLSERLKVSESGIQRELVSLQHPVNAMVFAWKDLFLPQQRHASIITCDS